MILLKQKGKRRGTGRERHYGKYKGTLKINLEKDMKMLIIQIHAPTLEADKKETAEFYEILEEIFSREKEFYNIIMGDWNTKIGRAERSEINLMGELGLGERN